MSHLALQPGTVIDGYEVIELLGRGGMGAVYRVRRGSSDFALKTLALSGSIELAAEEILRFRREGELLASLSHPGIVRVRAAGSKPGFLYFIMQLVEGESLEARLKREGALAPEEAVRIALEVADAVEHAHERGVVHRDLKPENILLEDGVRPLVTDFGLARRLGEENAERLTKTGEVLGTPAYLAPEQAFGLKEELDEKTDIYGLGVLLHAMLRGGAPFEGPSALAIMKKVSTEDPVPLEKAPPELEAFVLRAMAKVRAKRPPSARAFADELRKIPLEDAASFSRATWVLLGLALVSVGLVGAVAIRLGKWPSSGKTSSIADASTTAALTSSVASRKPGPYDDVLSLLTLEAKIERLAKLEIDKTPLPADRVLRSKIAAVWLENADRLDKELREFMKAGNQSFGLDERDTTTSNPLALKARSAVRSLCAYCASDPEPDLMADQFAFTLTMIQMLSRGSGYVAVRGEHWTEFWQSAFARFPDHPTIRFVRACGAMNKLPDAPPTRDAAREAHEARVFFETTKRRPHTRVLAHNFAIDVLHLKETPQHDLRAFLDHARYRDPTNPIEPAIYSWLKIEPEVLPEELFKPPVFFGWEKE